MKQETKNLLGNISLFIAVVAFLSLLLFIVMNPVSRIVEEESDIIVIDDNKNYYCFDDNEFDDFCEDIFYVVTVTKYNPTIDQCDSDPLITADGSYIDTLKLKNGELKWIAISRDLRSEFQYGDTVILSGTGLNDGEYVVRDTMNPRWKSRVDILSPKGDSKGKWEDVCLSKK